MGRQRAPYNWEDVSSWHISDFIPDLADVRNGRKTGRDGMADLPSIGHVPFADTRAGDPVR
jgi:hypothetical protein